MKKRWLLALALAAGCDKGDDKPKLQFNPETIRRLDAGGGMAQPVSSAAPDPTQQYKASSPAPQVFYDAGVPDAGQRMSPVTNQAPKEPSHSSKAPDRHH